MRHFTLDYRLEGERRGYAFTTPTDDLDSETLKALWRGTMPRGQGWDDPLLIGARSLKCFAVPSGEIALAEIAITDLRDETGRMGIRRAEIGLRSHGEHAAHLRARLSDMPAERVADAEAKLMSREWALLFKKQRRHQPPRSVVKPQTILTAPYSPEMWQFVETCILLLASRLTLLSNLIEVSPSVNPFADRALSFTTLALDFRDETRLIAIPLHRLPEGAPAVRIG
jgi:hypothetical protein